MTTFDPPASGLMPPKGRVVFVGAGPGDPELLTLAAVRVLNQADVILADGAEMTELLRQPSLQVDEALVASIDQLTGGAAMTAAERADLVGQAQTGGRLVVRLVKGDPFLDGGSSDEAAALVRSGLDLEIIPGVSALTALPEYAGVPLDGGLGLCLLSALEESFWEETERHWENIPTLVVQVQAADLVRLSEVARQAGRDGAEEALVTIGGGTTEQRTVMSNLAQLVDVQAGVDHSTEVQVVIGRAVTDYSADLDWFESKPLFGWRVLVPRTKDIVNPMITRLRSHGARVEEVPTISVEQPRNPGQLDKAIRGLVEGRFEWVVFTSRNAVRAVRERFDDYGLDARSFSGLKVAAASTATAEALQAWGIEPDLVGSADGTLASLADRFPEYDEASNPINRVFLPKADVATEAFNQALVDLGWEVEEIIAYRTVRAAPPPAETREAIKRGLFDAVVFSSSSTVRNLVGIAGKPHPVTVVAVIGPATANTCATHGLDVDVVAQSPTGLSLADGLAAFAAQRRAELLARGETVTRPSQRRGRRRAQADRP
ncbi:MAG: uroporphyrinogen-III synthase [Propionibacteriaceae bacterium]|nr:uroporphyrinogen-III synthase [Propionibacteriaceae bacterium]